MVKANESVKAVYVTKFITMREWINWYEGSPHYKKIRKVKGGYVIGFVIIDTGNMPQECRLADQEEIKIIKGQEL